MPKIQKKVIIEEQRPDGSVVKTEVPAVDYLKQTQAERKRLAEIEKAQVAASQAKAKEVEKEYKKVLARNKKSTAPSKPQLQVVVNVPAITDEPVVLPKIDDPIPARPEEDAAHTIAYGPPEPAIVDLSAVSLDRLVAEIKRRQRIPVGTLPDGAWFNLGAPGAPERLGQKLSGNLEGDVKVLLGRAQEHWSSQAPVYRWADPKAAASIAARTAPKPSQSPPATKPEGAPKTPSAGRSKSTIFGHPMTAVVRWMGAQKWDFARAWACLQRLGCQSTDASVKTFLRAGAKGERGELPSLTAEEVAELSKQ